MQIPAWMPQLAKLSMKFNFGGRESVHNNVSYSDIAKKDRKNRIGLRTQYIVDRPFFIFLR